MKNFFKKKKILKTLIFSIVIFGFVLPFKANAFPSGAEIATGLTNVIAQAIRYIMGIFLNLAAVFSDWMLTFNIEGIDKNNELITTGWQITRDLANLGFVLAIIMIGFATIIQFKNYGVKKLLPKLVIAALLVNFSFAIVTPILGFSNHLTKFFVQPAGESWGVSANIVGAFNPQKLMVPDEDAAPPVDPDKAGIGFGTAFLIGLANIFFTIIFTGLTTIVFAALGVMLLMRYVFLTFLLILSPIIWLAWVIPELGGQFKTWWSNFLKWAFFPPIVSFFIYLSLVGTEKLAESDDGFSSITASFTNVDPHLATILGHGAQMVVISALMFAGLYAADKMGIKGAKGAIGIANKTRGWAKGKANNFARNRVDFAKRNAMRAGSAIGRQKVKDEDGNKMSRAEKARRYANSRTNYFSKKIASWAASALTANEEMGTKETTKEYQNKVKGLSVERKVAKFAGASKMEKKEIIKDLAKEGKLNKLNPEEILTKDMKDLFNVYGEDKEFEKAEKASGISFDMLEARKNNGVDSDEFIKATEKFYGNMENKDAKNFPVKDIFNGKLQKSLELNTEEFNKFLTKMTSIFASENRSFVSKIIPELSRGEGKEFKIIYERGINELKNTNPEAAEQADKIWKVVIDNFESGGMGYRPEKDKKDNKKKDDSKDNDKEEAQKKANRKKARHS